MNYQTIQQQALARAIKDKAFRQALVSDPKAALAREFNVHFPDSVTIRVLEDTPTTHTIVLPPQEAAVQELSDAELEAVAGGMPFTSANETINRTCNVGCCIPQ
jgi:hypothetical protein